MMSEHTDDTGLRGKVVIVTGATGEDDNITNGRATAILLARAGAKVTCVGRTGPWADRTVEMISSEGGEAIGVAGDVTDEQDCRRIVETTVATFGRLDGLDNNVGTGMQATVLDGEIAEWRAQWQTNVESMILMSRYAIPAMVESGGGGSIVNVGSLRAIRPFAATPYSTTKGAVMALSQAMAVDHGPQGIRVNCLVLGPVFTTRHETIMSPEQREMRKGASLLGVEGNAWDTAAAIRFLLSDHSRYITGQHLVLDGGVSLKSPKR